MGEQILNGLLLAIVLSWALWRPLEYLALGLFFAVAVPYRLIQNRLQIGVWDIRPTMDVVDEILQSEDGARHA